MPLYRDKYRWSYISEIDVVFFDTAFWKTPNLMCDSKNNNVICKEKHYLDSMHKHWTIKNDEIELIHVTSKGEHKIKVTWQEIVLDENFFEYLVKLIKESHLIAQEIKDEGEYGEVSQEAIGATVASLVQKWSYNANITIKEMSADLLFSFACRHKFKNGNKRTALVSCVLFLKFCGLFLRNTNYDETEYMGYWEPFMESIVEDYSNSTLTEEETLEYIKSVIDNNVTISYTRYN